VSSLEKGLLRKVGEAIKDYNLIEDGDNILVALSGGKDSLVLLYLLELLRKRAPISFSIKAINVDEGFPGFKADQLKDFCSNLKIDFCHYPTNIYNIIQKKQRKSKSLCPLCSRLRRGILYAFAKKEKFNKLALAHNLDDFLETFFLNLFFAGKLKAMSPKLYADDGVNIVIRPMVYVEEKAIEKFIIQKAMFITESTCPWKASKRSKRSVIKNWLKKLTAEYPEIKKSILIALKRVHLRHLLDQRYLIV